MNDQLCNGGFSPQPPGGCEIHQPPITPPVHHVPEPGGMALVAVALVAVVAQRLRRCAPR